jgi:hypothetical protein
MAERGAERGMEWLGRLVGNVVTTGATALLTVAATTTGANREPVTRRTVDEDDEDYNPLLHDEEDGLPPVVAKAFATLGLRESGLHERTEGLYAMYRLLKAMELTDADIAKLAVQKAGERLDEGLMNVRPAEARPLFEALEQTVLRAAVDVDERLELRGDLVRPLREAVALARAGREEALSALDRGFNEGREGLRRALTSETAADERVL